MSVSADHLEGAAGDHLVHFYDDADDLASIVAPYLATGLRAGERAVVIATAEHRDAFESALGALGVNVRRAKQQARLVAVDATRTLERLMVDGNIDSDAFDHVIGEMIRGGEHPMRAYGELVDLLWDRGDVAQAIELEQLWNGLTGEVGFPLLCAYRSSGVADIANEDAVREVCHLHSSVTSSAPLSLGADGSDHEVVHRFAPGVKTPGAARRFLDDVLRGWGHGAASDDARLVISELVTNAVIHARSPFSVSVRAAAGTLRLAVHDQSPAQPNPPGPDPGRASGRGLQLVCALARQWGIERRPPGKVIWAELPID